MKHRIKAIFSFTLGLVLLVSLLAGCGSNGKIINHYYLSLSGESEKWKVESYEIVIKPETFEAGNGMLSMKNKTTYNTDFFSIEVHAVMDGRDQVIHSKSVSGSENDITSIHTGAISGGAYYDENGEPISIENISDIYMIVKWNESGKVLEETIDLFDQDKVFNS